MSEPPRPSSPPQPATIPLGNGGDYYVPGDGREPGSILAAWLLLATDEEAPEVRESLRSEVLPLVPAGHAYFDAWRNEDGFFDFCSDDWVLPEGPIHETGRYAGRPRAPMVPLILALRAWARRWRLASPHVMAAVMEVLNGWYTGELCRSLGVGASYRDGWGSEIESLTHGLSSEPDGEGEAWRKLFAAIGFNGAPADLRLSIEDFWEPRLETWQEFVGRVEERLARELERYRKDCDLHLEEHGFKKVPRPKARHHLSWLVQRRICGLTCEEIADRYAEENPELESPPSAGAVAKAIRRTAAMIELD